MRIKRHFDDPVREARWYKTMPHLFANFQHMLIEPKAYTNEE